MSRDLRKYARQTNIRLFGGFLVLLFGLGIGLIYLNYGAGAALFGVLCLLAGLAPLLLIWFVFVLIDWIVARANRD
jgi:TM2 domain-containing membrane protein YozV